MSQKYPKSGGDQLPPIANYSEKQNVSLISKPVSKTMSPSKIKDEDIEGAAFNQPASVKPIANEKTKAEHSFATVNENDNLTSKQKSAKEKKTGCFGKNGLIRNIFNGGSTLMSYSASTLSIHETRSEQPKISTTVVNTSCWTFIIIVFLGLIALNIINTVGKFKNVVLTEETEIEQTMVLDRTTFPLHNFLKFGPMDDLKNRIGQVLYQQQVTSSSRRRNLETSGTANDLTEETCVSSSAQNYFDAAAEVCYTCPDYYIADTSALNCVQNICAEEQIYAKDGSCQNCPSYYRANSDYTECINDAASCTATQILSLTGQCTDCQANYRANSDKTTCINDLATCSPIQYLSSDGYCRDCDNQFRASSDRLSCIQDSCTDIQIYTAIGKCQNCDTYSRSNAAKTECINDKASCSETQYLDSKGYCIDCEANSRGNSAKTACINDVLSCTSTQYLDAAGYCVDCQANFRGSQDKLSCINDFSSCSATQYLSSDGYCTDCAANSRANADKLACINDKDSCSSTQVLDATGYCTDCPNNFRANADKLLCINDKDSCSPTQILTSDGFCTDCPSLFRGNDDKKECVNDKDSCSITQILTSDGYCTDCDEYFRANSEKTECITDTCEAREFKDITGVCSECQDYFYPADDQKSCVFDTCSDVQKLRVDGTCEDCQPYNRADETGKVCISDPCDYSTQIILTDGTCSTCETYFRPDASDFAKNCIQDDCDTNQNEIHRSDGTCTRCQDYSYPGLYFNETSGQGVCVTDTCENSTQILLINGTCQICQAFKHPDEQNLACISDVCNATQILIEDGTCQQCEDYKRADETGRICRPDTCDNSLQILLIDGSCQTCEEYTKPDSDNRKCISEECDAATEILKPDGNCEVCPAYSRPDEANRVCITDECDFQEQILLQNGTCQECPAHFYPNWDQTNPATECKQDTCDHSNTEAGREILNTDGICEKCPEFTRPSDDDPAKECIVDPCDYLTQILLADGTCSTCETHTYPDWNQVDPAKVCIKDDCDHSEDDGREILAATGKCEVCPEFTYPKPVSDTYLVSKECIFDQCDAWSQIILSSGRCQTCSPYSYPEGYTVKPADATTAPVSRACIQVSCDQEKDIMTEQRQCQTCADYFYPDALGQNCIQDTCITLTQILIPSGKCEDCPEFTFPDGNNRECLFPACDHTYQIISSSGTCQDCPAYSYPDTIQLTGDSKPTSCLDLGCDPATDIMTKPAPYTCQPCQEYSYPNAAGDQCLTDTCDNRSQILGINGKCSDCGEYTYPNGQNLLCISDDCDFTKQVLNRQGSCTTCGPYEYPGDDKKTCVTVNCNIRTQILNSDNECETCGDYSYPSADGTTCQSDSCNTTIEVVAKTGKCLACEEYTFPNPDDSLNRECISETCSDDETLKRNGRCVLKSQLFDQDKPSENAIRTQLRIEGNIADMQTAEAQETFKTNLASAMGFDTKYIQIQSVYAGSIVVVYDLVADENMSPQQLAQASQDAFKSGAVEGAVGTVLDVTQKDPSGTELQIVKDGKIQPIPDVAVVLTEADLNIPEVVVDPASALAQFITGLTTEDMKNFLCKNYYITLQVLNYKTETKQMKFSGCEFIESDTPNEYVLHHYFTENDKISEFKFEQSADLTGISVESQQFVTIDQQKSKDQSIKYPSIVEEEYTHTLFSTNRQQTFGATYLPTDSKLHLRQEKTVKQGGNTTAIVFFNELGDMHPQYYSSIQRYGTKLEIDLKYDFVTKVHTDVYYTFYDAIFIFIIIFPVVGFTLAGLIFLINIVYFYQHLTQLIKRRYKDAQNWQAAQKYLKKFRKIHSALEGMEPYAHILTELETYLNIEWDKLTYEETITQTKKMETLDSLLPNLDDLEINLSKFTMNEAEKAKQQEIETIMQRRTQLSVIDILDLVKKRVSIFGVYQLYDDLEMKDANLRSEIKISNAKLEFLYRTLDRKSHKKRTQREKTN